jgi:hypothetical protein
VWWYYSETVPLDVGAPATEAARAAAIAAFNETLADIAATVGGLPRGRSRALSMPHGGSVFVDLPSGVALLHGCAGGLTVHLMSRRFPARAVSLGRGLLG